MFQFINTSLVKGYGVTITRPGVGRTAVPNTCTSSPPQGYPWIPGLQSGGAQECIPAPNVIHRVYKSLWGRSVILGRAQRNCCLILMRREDGYVDRRVRRWWECCSSSRSWTTVTRPRGHHRDYFSTCANRATTDGCGSGGLVSPVVSKWCRQMVYPLVSGAAGV